MIRSFRMGRPLVLASALAVSACAGTPPPVVTPPPAQMAELSDRQIDAAEAAMAEGKLDEAAQLYARVLAHTPDEPRARLGVAELKLARGDDVSARHMFEKLAEIPEIAPRAHQGIGLALVRAGRKETARQELEEAVGGDPGLWRSWNALGHLHDSAARWDLSAEAYAKALETTSNRAAILNNIGFSLMLQRKWDDAVSRLTEAVRVQPDFDLARNNLRLALAWQGRYVAALSGVERGAMPVVLNNVGYAAMMRGDYTAAEGYLTRAAEASSSYFEPAAMNLLRLDSLKEAEKAK